MVPATQADHEIAFKINTRLVSYGVPFYAALLWSSRVDSLVGRFSVGLFGLWTMMALGLVAIAAKDLMLVVGAPVSISRSRPSNADYRAGLSNQRPFNPLARTGDDLAFSVAGHAALAATCRSAWRARAVVSDTQARAHPAHS